MTGVVIAASDRDKKMWIRLPGVLSSNFSSIFSPEGSGPADSEVEFEICGLQGAGRLQSDQAVIIFKDIQDSAVLLPAGRQAVAVVDSCNPQLLEYVSTTRLPAITCGLSARDTLTLSSIGVDSAVVNLQRSVTCFDGTVAEPQEIPIKLTAPMDSFTLMAASSVFILSGNIEHLRDAIF